MKCCRSIYLNTPHNSRANNCHTQIHNSLYKNHQIQQLVWVYLYQGIQQSKNSSNPPDDGNRLISGNVMDLIQRIIHNRYDSSYTYESNRVRISLCTICQKTEIQPLPRTLWFLYKRGWWKMIKYIASDTGSHKGIIIVSLNVADVVIYHPQSLHLLGVSPHRSPYLILTLKLLTSTF